MILRELLAKFGVAYDDAGAKKADKDVAHLSRGFKELIALVGGAALVRGFGQFLVQQVQLADAIGDTAARLGIGVEALQELRFAGQDVGLSLEGVDAALGRLVRGSAEAARGQGEAKDAFRELGVSLTDGQGNLRSFDEILTQVADGMGNAKTDADRLRLGYALFGREGSKFAATMAEGSAGIEELRLKARELGGILSVEQVEAADKADKAIAGFGLALGGLKHQIAAQFIPALTEGLARLSRWLKPMQDLVRTSHIVEGTVVALGGALAVLFGGARLLALTKAAIAFGVIALAIDEMITFAKGGDTVIGRLLDQFKGMGSSAVVLENWKVGLKLMAEYAETFAKNLKAGWEVLKQWNQQREKQKELDRRAEFDSRHAQWERRKKWVEEHPDLPAFMRTVPEEPVWKPNAPGGGEDWEELRTRQVASDRGVTSAAQSAEDVARARTAGAQPAAEAERGVPRVTSTGLAGSGRSEQRSMPPAYTGLPAAFATAASAATPKAGPVINQTTTINVDGSGISDANELARIIDRRVRKAQADEYARTLRALREVPP